LRSGAIRSSTDLTAQAGIFVCGSYRNFRAQDLRYYFLKSVFCLNIKYKILFGFLLVAVVSSAGYFYVSSRETIKKPRVLTDSISSDKLIVISDSTFTDTLYNYIPPKNGKMNKNWYGNKNRKMGGGNNCYFGRGYRKRQGWNCDTAVTERRNSSQDDSQGNNFRRRYRGGRNE
jgi:hypothetical protein